MKTALDLPDELAREVKIHAAQQGRKLKDVVADLLRRGLDAVAEPTPELSTPLLLDPITSLPTVACRHSARTVNRLTPTRVARILLDQEIAWNNEAGR
jgi:plasmid stability protein